MITIEEAIETLTQQVRYYHQIHQLDIIQSLELGIEALKQIDRYRQTGSLSPNFRLPGETKE